MADVSQDEKQEGGNGHDLFLLSSGGGAGAGVGAGAGPEAGGAGGGVGPGPPGNARIMVSSLPRAFECGARDPLI